MGGCSRPPAAFVRRAWCAWVPRVRICAHVWRREDAICDVGERDALEHLHVDGPIALGAFLFADHGVDDFFDATEAIDDGVEQLWWLRWTQAEETHNTIECGLLELGGL